MPAIHQRRIIDNLNKYFAYNNLPIKMAEYGICNGLSCLYIKYVLEGKEQKFLQILNYIADGILQDEISEDDINHFAVEVYLSHEPEPFDQQLNQKTAIGMLHIDNKKLKSCFDFSLVSSEENWVKVIKELNLKENEVVHLSSMNHAVAFRKIETGYRLYDPNFKEGYWDLPDEENLIRVLNKICYRAESNLLGMSLSIIRHPNDISSRSFPDSIELYKKYMMDVNDVAQHHGIKQDSLWFTARAGTYSEINYLLEKGATEIYSAADRAIYSNNFSVILPLMDKITDKKERFKLFGRTALDGRYECFKVFLQNDLLGELEQDYIKSGEILDDAAYGGNPQILAESIQLYKNINFNEISDKNYRELIFNYSANYPIISAIRTGNIPCLHILLKEIESTGLPLDDDEKIFLLNHAIGANQPHMVLELIEKNPGISSEILQKVQIPVSWAENSNLYLLKILEEKGVNLSTATKSIMEKKQHQSISLIKEAGIILTKLTDFIKEKIYLTIDISINMVSGITQLLKNQLNMLRSENNEIEPISHKTVK